MKHILLSVKRPWSELILSGEKSMELRKNFPDGDEEMTLWIYESGKDGMRQIIGKCMYYGHGLVWSKERGCVVKWVSLHSRVDCAGIVAYVPCHAWLVGCPVRIDAVPLSVIGLRRPPQSWQYLRDDQVAMLEGGGR